MITRLGEIGITTLRFTEGEPLLRLDLFQVLTSINPDNHVANPPCILGFTTLYISSDGALRSGCYALPPIGNVLETGIAELLHSQAYRERCMAMLKLECPECACNVFKSLHYKYLLQDVARSIIPGASSNQV